MSLPLETFWAEILSRNPERISTAWNSLNEEEQAVVKKHLRKMSSEEGWTQPQRDSAAAALEVIDKND